MTERAANHGRAPLALHQRAAPPPLVGRAPPRPKRTGAARRAHWGEGPTDMCTYADIWNPPPAPPTPPFLRSLSRKWV